MARPEKVAVVDDIKQKLESSRGVFVTEYRGMTVGQQQQLRRQLRAANAEYRIMKMSLARRAAEAAGFPDLLEWLEGPTAIAFTEGDPVPAAKSLKDFSDDNEFLVLKGGLLAGETLMPDDVKRLASIEPREVLLAKLAGAMAAPMAKLAGLMTAILRQPASAMQQLLEKKEAEPSAAPEPAEAVAEPVEAAAEPEEAADEDTAEEPAAEDAGSEDAAAEAVASPEAAEEPAGEEPGEEPAAEEPAAEADDVPADAETAEEAAEADVEPEADTESPAEDSKDSE
ncbi:MAG: 50S ribosomal protein L10 [Acidimicrobiia bacterium]|nr:50S ribosomal protein L10 [Acidimicrobiia bacterium]